MVLHQSGAKDFAEGGQTRVLTLLLVGAPNLVTLTLPKVVLPAWCYMKVDWFVSMTEIGTVEQPRLD